MWTMRRRISGWSLALPGSRSALRSSSVLGGPLVRRLGPSAVGAINKIFGFLILAIAVQLVWDGVADFGN